MLKYVQKSVNKSTNQKLVMDIFLKKPTLPKVKEFSKPKRNT